MNASDRILAATGLATVFFNAAMAFDSAQVAYRNEHRQGPSFETFLPDRIGAVAERAFGRQMGAVSRDVLGFVGWPGLVAGVIAGVDYSEFQRERQAAPIPPRR